MGNRGGYGQNMNQQYGRGGRPGGGGGRALPQQAVAPYNFVPLAAEPHLPTYTNAVSQEVPFRDGVCGTLDLEIEAKTPLFIRGIGDRTSFFALPDGTPAIPGTSLKGMLRNVVEIATFGKMNQVNDHRYGVRDLNNREVYGNYMAEIYKGQPVPLVSAGWLSYSEEGEYSDDDELHLLDDDRKWVIEPCDFAKIEYRQLQVLARQKGVPNFDPDRKQSAVDKYKKWGDRDEKDLKVNVAVQLQCSHGQQANSGVKRVGNYGRVGGLDGPVQATVVMTGQPSDNDPNRPRRAGGGNPKHHDFVFFNEGKYGRFVVPFEQRRDFSFVHGGGGEQHRIDLDPNTEWKHMLGWLKSGRRVPVFFLNDAEGNLRAFGLAMMFRLAYKLSTHQTVKQTQGSCDNRLPDLAELIFGRVWQDRRNRSDTEALRGRVSIEQAVIEGPARVSAKRDGVLGAPRASYYPNYLLQGGTGGSTMVGGGGRPSYLTYMDEGKTRVRGWKRYPRRLTLGELPKAPTEKVKTEFKPLPTGTRFRARVHVHNLREHELGALLWALDFGGREDCWHALGMARSCGYGSVTLRVVGQELLGNAGGALDEAFRSKAVNAFRGYMNAALGGQWEQSEQVFQLVAMAEPVGDDRAKNLRHMLISHPEYRNEFQGVKQAGKSLAAWGDNAQRQRHKEHCAKMTSAPWDGPMGTASPSKPSSAEAPSSSAPVKAAGATSAPAPAPKPAAPAPQFPPEEQALHDELSAAFVAGSQNGLLHTWKSEKSHAQAALRLQVAKRIITLRLESGETSKKWFRRNPDITQWLGMGMGMGED